MRKKISLVLCLIMALSLFTGCGKKEQNPWQKDDNTEAEVATVDEYQGLDRNLVGVLYTDENKEEGAVEITIYDNMDKYLKVEPHKSYALKENINIDYLLNTIEAHSAGNNIELKGYVVGNTAMVNLPEEALFARWLVADYPDNFDVYNKPLSDNNSKHTDARYYAHNFTLVAMEIIDKTLKANLDVETVVFKTQNDEAFFTIDDGLCCVDDGIFFKPDGLPRYFPSQYNYYGNKSFKMLIEEFSEEFPQLKDATLEEQLKYINQSIENY